MHEQLHQYVLDAVEEIRRKFNELHISGFRLDIECSGRVEGGEPRIAYKLSDDSDYSANAPSGARLGPTIDEALRRHQWNKRNDPLALPAPDSSEEIAERAVANAEFRAGF